MSTERRALRATLGFIRARTVFFDDAVLDAIDRGVKQVVILGAGYDGRALRFRTPGVQFFEVDHPATQVDKLRRLAYLGVASDGNLVRRGRLHRARPRPAAGRRRSPSG